MRLSQDHALQHKFTLSHVPLMKMLLSRLATEGGMYILVLNAAVLHLHLHYICTEKYLPVPCMNLVWVLYYVPLCHCAVVFNIALLWNLLYN